VCSALLKLAREVLEVTVHDESVEDTDRVDRLLSEDETGGHADSKMTMDAYAQLQQRAKRDHGAHFDELVRQARVQLRTPEETAPNASIGTAIGTGGQKSPISAPDRVPAEDQEHGSEQAKTGMARPGFEPGTPRFSVVCSTN
jgi:hypothetical protein